MKGLRTILFNGAVVIGTSALTYIAGVDWAEVLDPTTAAVVMGVANIGLRVITSTPVFKSE